MRYKNVRINIGRHSRFKLFRLAVFEPNTQAYFIHYNVSQGWKMIASYRGKWKKFYTTAHTDPMTSQSVCEYRKFLKSYRSISWYFRWKNKQVIITTDKYIPSEFIPSKCPWMDLNYVSSGNKFRMWSVRKTPNLINTVLTLTYHVLCSYIALNTFPLYRGSTFTLLASLFLCTTKIILCECYCIETKQMSLSLNLRSW